MSTLKVTIEQVTVHPHSNADRLELAQVGLNRAVILKGQFKTGDFALYIPEGSVLPPELIEELGLTGKLAGRQGNRVKAVRLRGEISQGIVCRPSQITKNLGENVWRGRAQRASGNELVDYDFAQMLGIVKWVPPIPPELAGKVYAPERLLKWPDIESIKRYPQLFQPGEPVVATEKVHGTCFLLTWMDQPGQPNGMVAVSSKGVGGNGLAIEESKTNMYWRAVHAYNLAAFADRASLVAGAPTVGLFGEVYGAGIQDLSYGVDTSHDDPGFVLFDIAVDYGDGVQVFLRPEEFHRVVTEVNEQLLTEGVIDHEHVVGMAPVLYDGPYDEALLLQLAEGQTEMGGGPQIREGLVVRPAKEAISEVTGERKIGKIVGLGYATRGGHTTEFE